MKRHFWSLPTAVMLGTLTMLGMGAEAKAALLVGNTQGNNVLIYDERSGKFGGEFIPAGLGGLESPDDLTFGPDGNLYISSGSTTSGAILKYDGKTGTFLGRFDQGDALIRPYGVAFGPDGKLYVSSFRTDEIVRYDAMTGAFLDVFAAGDGLPDGLNGPNDLLFGADGSLYVTTQGSVALGGGEITFPGYESQVLKYDIATGDFEVFIAQPTPSPDSFGFVSFLGIVFGPNSDLFVSDFANDIRRYDLAGNLLDVLPTNFTGTVPSSNFMGNLTFDPNNILYTTGFDFSTSANKGAILRYDGVTGQPLPALGQSGAVFVPTTANLKRPIGITYAPITVPEPATMLALLALGAVGAATVKRDRPHSENL